MSELDDITGAIVDSAVKIHKELGPGLLESVYEAVLARALERRNLQVVRQKSIRFEYDGMVFDEGFKVDMVVEGRVVVELKSVERLAPVHKQTAPHVPPPNEPLRRPTHQFRWCDPQRRPRTDRQPPPALRLSAPPREPTQQRPLTETLCPRHSPSPKPHDVVARRLVPLAAVR